MHSLAMDGGGGLRYNPRVVASEAPDNDLEVFAHLVMALVFKTSVGFGKSSKWVRFPYTSVSIFGPGNAFLTVRLRT